MIRPGKQPGFYGLTSGLRSLAEPGAGPLGSGGKNVPLLLAQLATKSGKRDRPIGVYWPAALDVEHPVLLIRSVKQRRVVSLSRRIRDSAYADPEDLVRALARMLNAEARDLAAAGARLLQIDKAVSGPVPGGDRAGGRGDQHRDRRAGRELGAACLLRQPVRPAAVGGALRFLFPAVQDTRVDRLALECARKGDEDLRLLEKFHWDRGSGSA